jgi:Zn-dependent protease with chaperone function
MNNLDRGPNVTQDPNLRGAAAARHQELAAGMRRLPNLAIRSAFTVFLLYGLLTLALIIAVQFGYLTENLALGIGLVFGLLQFTIGPWVMDWSLSWLYAMNWVSPQQLPEHLRQFVDQACREQGLKFPRFGVIQDGAPQAFTYGHHPNNARIVISRGTIELLTPAELEGVVAHEIGHARHWDMVLMTVVNLVPLLLFYLYRALTRWGSKRDKAVPVYITAGAYVLYIISQYIVLWFSRTREFYADRFSGMVTRNPNALMTALVKIAYGLAAQDSKTASLAASDRDELISLNLSGKAESKSSSKPAPATRKTKQEKREIAGVGAFAALGIFDRNAAVSMVLNSTSALTTGAASAMSGLDPERVQSAMQWDMWNPWARWYELHSTHPLVARRLEYLADQAAALGQQPAIVFSRKQPESYWDEFAVDLLVMTAPFLGALTGLAYAFWSAIDAGQFGWNLVAPAIALGGLGLLIKNFYRYRRGPFTERTVADLLAEIKVSPVRPVPATIAGKIIGRGVPGLLYSEDFVVRDSTGILFLDYQQPLAIWNFLFGLLRSSEYQNTAVRATGWFRRAPVPYFEILRLEEVGSDKVRTCYSSYASFFIAALMLLAGAWMWLLK